MAASTYAASAATRRGTTLNRNQFYLGYIVFPAEINQATPAESSFPTNLPCIQSPTSPEVQRTFSAGDPTNPPYRRLRDPKYHPILVHRYDPEDEVATVFVASSHLVYAHRFVPVADAPCLRNQPPEGIHLVPDGLFEGQRSYLNFSHPVKCQVVFESVKIEKGQSRDNAGRALVVHPKDDQGQIFVTIAPDEKKKLLRYHWRYWRNVRYDDNQEEDSKDSEPDGGEADAVAGGGVNADQRGGGAGRGDCGNAGGSGGGSGAGSSSQSRKAWAERVQYALTHPDVPEEKDDSLKPFLFVVGPLSPFTPLKEIAYELENGFEDCLASHGRRVGA
ncbi:uncharacterized protein EV422DRAFT_567103 [Fimicolochytrium jonesii]|uniref:uncharacterized protein n=1 Tax=Fimicolochytrium jonesii TaxID=1396493 RepID=UPI0022FEC416|nr:uncharacterized protein EV422DRAFT_567103 [Fimicolochytrium jonesii]KAI8821361.1 hypothetical protein EV422DRAFT_567103 [Fimicolochytrium jonesii]